MGEEIDERAGGRFYDCRWHRQRTLDGSQVPGGKNADLAIKWRYRDPTRRITLDLPRSKTGKPASSTICCRLCTARATRCYSRGDVAHEPDLRSRHSGWAPLSRTRQCERQLLGGVWFGSTCVIELAKPAVGFVSDSRLPSDLVLSFKSERLSAPGKIARATVIRDDLVHGALVIGNSMETDEGNAIGHSYQYADLEGIARSRSARLCRTGWRFSTPIGRHAEKFSTPIGRHAEKNVQSLCPKAGAPDGNH